MGTNALVLPLIIVVVIVAILVGDHLRQQESNPNPKPQKSDTKPEPQKPAAKPEKFEVNYRKLSKQQLEYLRDALCHEYGRIGGNLGSMLLFGRVDILPMLQEDDKEKKHWEELREKYGLKDDPEQERFLINLFLWIMSDAIMGEIIKVIQALKQIEKAEQMRNYYAYNALHPRNHDGNPFNDLPGAGMIHGTDSNLWRF